DAVLAHRVAHGATLGDGQRQRLLAVNILPRLARLDDGDGVPVVRRADLDCIDVLPPEEFAIVRDGIAAAIRPGGLALRIVPLDQALGGLASADLALPLAGALAIHVADGDDLDALVFQERAEVIEALVARPDDAQRDPVAGGDLPRTP